jgi:septum formation protein
MTRESTDKRTLVLASSSPRRRDLLAEAGVAFRVVEPTLAEPAPSGLSSPVAVAEALAYFKARSVQQRCPHEVVLGADTVVARGGQVYGKPANADDARRMLRELSHERHAVITGVALLDGQSEGRWIASETTWVTMTPMGADQIEAYIATGEWEGKAGAYAIQETADRYVERLDGSFSNVVGLPVELVLRMLDRIRGGV